MGFLLRNLLTLVPEGEGGLWNGGELIHHHFPRFSFTRCQKSCPPQREESRGWERRLLFCPHVSCRLCVGRLRCRGGSSISPLSFTPGPVQQTFTRLLTCGRVWGWEGRGAGKQMPLGLPAPRAGGEGGCGGVQRAPGECAPPSRCPQGLHILVLPCPSREGLAFDGSQGDGFSQSSQFFSLNGSPLLSFD